MATEVRHNPIKELKQAGQSLWLDNIRRQLITSGELARLRDEGLTGVTSNPTIFGKAVSGSSDYSRALSGLWHHRHPPGESRAEPICQGVTSAPELIHAPHEKPKGNARV